MTGNEELSPLQSLQLSELQPADLPRVSEIHVAAFRNSALTVLGAEAVRRYYHWLLTGPHDCVALGASIEADVMGFCFAGVFDGALSGFLSQNRAFLFGRILSRPWLGLNPLIRERVGLGMRIMQRLGRQPAGTPDAAIPDVKAEPQFGVLAIAVHPDSHGLGIGKALMFEAERIARSRSFKEMQLTVQTNNHQAIAFYQSLSWGKYLLDGTWQGEMRKSLVD
jgi:ribosomal protein S18 acetylase RimI-like enzyme